ncbi:IucA/IucC family siderophore biosynthesis protein [Halobacillus litoralis]|uniref:IucA/IucC family protein n=1 Tax=Halobacillus litoralis TaxID=45668 RepID=UPI001CD3D0B3|nr:IucA/IucC family protein [Halobacillus litoralis]MCA0972121.1 IucA/IucC family siderophore biosynthesis protein [Halobacillus litoralis]
MTMPLQTKQMTDLLPEEQKCLRYLMEHHPDDAPAFMDQLDQGRRSILHKLASAILRENIDGLYSKAVDLRSGVATPYAQQLERYPLRSDLVYKLVPLEGYAIVFPILNEYSFRRVETCEDLLYVDDHEVKTIQTASELVDRLFQEHDYPNVTRFKEELDNGTANMTLALVRNQVWKKPFDARNTMDVVQKERALNPAFSASLFYEQLVLEGHHLHPGAKTKLGLSYEDVERYAPEYHRPFDVRFVAVKRTHLVSTDATPVLRDDFPGEWEKAQAELHDRGYRAVDYDVLPVHPWQFEHAIPDIYRTEIEADEVILLKEVRLMADATSSFRTVSPHGEDTPVLKLAVNSQMTSTVRSISPQTALNSRVFTEMMERILERDPLPRFVPLNETKGAAFKSSDALKKRNLTMLIRESVDANLEEGEVAVAGMALYATSPMSGKTVLEELVEASGQTPLHFFEQYIRTVLPGYLTLMVKYGVALEGHLQNSVPVFRNGKISRFFFRDWGGSRIYKPRLLKQGIEAAFAEGSVSVTDDVSDMHNKLYYTVFQNHIGEIIRQLADDESVYWELVKKVCEETLDQLEGLEEEVAVDRGFLFQPTVMHKSLTKMRLTDRKEYDYTEVPNPLS